MAKKAYQKSALKEGLLVNEIKHNSEDTIIVSKEIKRYKEGELEFYINKFENYKEKNRIRNCNFKDLRWTICQAEENGNITSRNIDFSFEIKSGVNEIIKAYTINLITNALGINHIAQEIKIISNIIYMTNFFDINGINELEEYVDSAMKDGRLVFKDTAMKFISFIRDRVDDCYCDYLIGLPNDVVRNVREIPDYTSILRFDYIIENYISARDDEFFRFHPIVLWWKICSKIPMRPSEFLILKKESFYELKGKYYIVVKRSKPHGFINRVLNIRKIQTYRINKEIYDLVMKVINHKFHDSSYLLSKNLYYHYNDSYTFIKNSIEGQGMNWGNLDKCLSDFYVDEINKKYNLKPLLKCKLNDYEELSKNDFFDNYIVSLQLGDARHLAIINLVLQGTNSYIVREMCGHRDINSHCHYVDHAKTYITSKILVLTEIRKMELKMTQNNAESQYSSTNKRNEKVVNYNSKRYKKVGDYYCKRYVNREELFPYFCLTDCEECNDKVKIIHENESILTESEIIKNKLEIERQFEIIAAYLKDAKFNSIIDSSMEKTFFESQKNVEEAANKLEYLISKEAELEARKFFDDIIE